VVICLEFQLVKAEHRHPTRLLQPHAIPESKWEVISMDFIVGFPLMARIHDSIFVVVDTLMNNAHFIPFQEALGTQLNFSTAYHPKTDGKTERTKPNLGRHVAHVRDGPTKALGIILSIGRIRL
jgi:hypothetical protein